MIVQVFVTSSPSVAMVNEISHHCLQETKLFVGMGFPYEGPAPLEAIAQGCFFLNPRLDPPRNRENSVFFKGKPTLRAVSYM